MIQDKEKKLEALQSQLADPVLQTQYNQLTQLTTEASVLETDISKMYERWQILEQKMKG